MPALKIQVTSMICLIALAVFGILGIFSASHRQLAKEAFDCVFKRITLRKCTTGFDRKMKLKISTGLLKFNPLIGRIVFKYFEIFSWILTILTIASLAYSALGFYNFLKYGSCDPSSPTTCIYNQISNGLSNQAQIVSDKNSIVPKNFTPVNGKCPPNYTPASG